MTRDLFNLEESKILFIDSETVRARQFLDEDSPEWKDFRWKMRDRENDKLPYVEETKELYRRKAALYPTYSKIVAITCGVIHNERIVLKTFQGEEAELLDSFVNMVKGNVGFTQAYWNMEFDVPMIRKRFYINKLKDFLPDSMGNDSMKKPWNLKGLVDLMSVWKGIGFFNDSMSEVAVAMGLESPKDEMNGFEVSDKYYEGKIDEIVRYNQKDVVTLINLYRIFTEKEPIYEVVVRDNEVQYKKEDLPLLKRIYAANELSDSIKGQLQELTKKKKPTKKDKENLKRLVLAHYLTIGDKVDVKKRKTEEVNDLIDTL